MIKLREGLFVSLCLKRSNVHVNVTDENDTPGVDLIKVRPTA
jgi:hypothetical protein